MSDREAYNIRVLGQELYDKVASSKILLIGAGGIGCELLKDLVLSGFKNIEVASLFEPLTTSLFPLTAKYRLIWIPLIFQTSTDNFFSKSNILRKRKLT